MRHPIKTAAVNFSPVLLLRNPVGMHVEDFPFATRARKPSCVAADETIFHPRDDMQADAVAFRNGFRHDIARAKSGINIESGFVGEDLAAPERITATPGVDINDVEIVGSREINGQRDGVLGNK